MLCLLSYTFLTLLSQPFTNGFPSAYINELHGSILLQVMNSTFKDHTVTWVDKYLVITHIQACGDDILDNIGRWYITPYQLLTQE